MVTVTVYLAEGDAVALRRLAAVSGRSQAEIIREAIRRATSGSEPRRLRSVGAGRGSGEAVARHADAIVRADLGGSTR